MPVTAKKDASKAGKKLAKSTSNKQKSAAGSDLAQAARPGGKTSKKDASKTGKKLARSTSKAQKSATASDLAQATRPTGRTSKRRNRGHVLVPVTLNAIASEAARGPREPDDVFVGWVLPEESRLGLCARQAQTGLQGASNRHTCCPARWRQTLSALPAGSRVVLQERGINVGVGPAAGPGEDSERQGLHLRLLSREQGDELLYAGVVADQ